MANNHVRRRLSAYIKRVTRLAYITALPMRLLDFLIMRGIRYVSYALYYPTWLWRHKTMRNGLVWIAIAAALIAKQFGSAVLFGILLTVGQFAMAAMYMVFQFAIMFIFLSDTKNVEILPGDKGVVTFEKDFFGQEHQKEVVLGNIALMSRENQALMNKIGAEPPCGMMLTGPPGTGKTWIAQCTAGEVNIPYIGLNGSDFNAMFMGVAEMKVRSVAGKGQKWADRHGGCIIFIDEMDAVTSSRGGVEGEESTVQRGGGGIFGGGGMGVRSQLLSAMDGTRQLQLRKKIVNVMHRFFGFEEVTQGRVFWLGATNRIGAVDSAFLRPGRMDVIVQMDPPDKGSRRKIIQGYVDRVLTDETVDVERLTNDTQGSTPADIAAAVTRLAVRFTLKDGRTTISMADIQAALLEREVGVANPISEFDEGQREQVATHEAGHAVLSRLLMRDQWITHLSIIRRGKGILGFMRDVSDTEIYAMPLTQLCARIQILWAGDIACEILMGERWTGGRGDFNRIDQFMKALAGHGYFADRLPLDPFNPFADEEIAEAANRYQVRVKASVRAIIQHRRPLLEALRNRLLAEGELDSAVIYEILEAHGL